MPALSNQFVFIWFVEDVHIKKGHCSATIDIVSPFLAGLMYLKIQREYRQHRDTFKQSCNWRKFFKIYNFTQTKIYSFDKAKKSLMSVLLPGGFSVVVIASVDIASTRVAVRPPCSVSPALRCSSDTSISHVHLPSAADNTLTWRDSTPSLYWWKKATITVHVRPHTTCDHKVIFTTKSPRGHGKAKPSKNASN